MKETELINLRGKREKHFLQENGDIVAKMYSDDIHFYNNGVFEEIDNTLVKEDNYYCNKKNSYKVYFKEICSGDFIKFIMQKHYLKFELLNCKNESIKISNFESKLMQQVIYKNIFDNIDLVYDVLPTSVKENIIINDFNSMNEKIKFKISSDLSLILNENNSISIEDLLCFEKPFIIDADGKISNSVYYDLIKENNYYILEIKLDIDSIVKDNLRFPLSIDPTITNYGENNTVYDTYIYPNDTNDVRYDKEYIKVGVESNGNINRALIKFELPKIGTGSQIINAELQLRGFPDYTYSFASDIVTIHRITEPWTESGANWNNMNDKYDSRVEAAFESSRMFYVDGDIIYFSLNGDNLTNLVKKWYSMYPNYGLMLKTADEVYHQSVIPMFFSKNNTVSGGNPKPLLIITYRNQNGLENYMDYRIVPLVNGNSYVNSYNGNLTTKIEVGKTIKGKQPVNLDLIYNTNDVILENNLGYGKGYKLNVQQTIKPVTIDQKNYLEYLDEDGTIHYFLSKNNEYIDEDGLNLTIVQNENTYILKDKKNNCKIFTITNNIGHLTSIENCDGSVVTIEYNNNFTVSRITDANNNQINLTYGTDIITINSLDDTVYLNFTNNKISSIARSAGTTYINYDSNNLISSILDEDGLKIGFEYYSQEPYRVKKVCQYATDNTIGNYYNMSYNYNSTTIKSNNNNIRTMTYNDNGCIESNSNLNSEEDVYNAYGKTIEYSNPVESESDLSYLKYRNKLLNIDLPYKYVKNYIPDSSFENDSVIFTATSDVTLAVTTEQSNTGAKSLKATNQVSNQVLTKNVVVTKGNYYTFSASIKNIGNIKISLSYTDSSNNVIEQFEEIEPSSTFERSDVSIFYPSDAISDLILKVYLIDIGTTYIDDIQLEDGEVANAYNLLDNSDFSDGLTGWNLTAMDRTGQDVPTSNVFEVVTLSTGKKALKVKMSPLYNTSFYKHFNIAGKTGDTCRVSFWYKNQGLKGSEDAFTRTNNRVIIRFNYTDEQHGHCILPSKQFNPNENEWQFFSASFIAEHDFNSMDLNFYQEFNANNFYITNLYVIKDYRTINYNYDDEGNITSVSTLNNLETQFNYNDDNELIKILSPNGNYFKYEYNRAFPSKINTAISKEKILTKIKYDNNGNPVSTKIISNKNQFDITGGGLVKIRIKGTNKYVKLINQEISITERDCRHNFWYIDTSQNDYYLIYNPNVHSRFLGMTNNSIVSTEQTQLEICYNDDESCYIKKYGTNNYFKYDSSLDKLIVSTLEENNDDFKFYLETTNNKKFIENNATYTQDGRFVQTLTDSMINTTTYNYDNNTGLLLSKTNAKGVITEYSYNNKQQITSIQEGNREVNYTYNNNNLLSKIETDNKEYSFEYDKFLNIKKFKVNNDTLITNNFGENNGNLISSTYGNGQTINFNYDDFGRLNQIVQSDNTFNYKYDNNGNLKKIISNDQLYKYYYDLSNRIKKYQYNDFTLKYNYNDSLHHIYKNYILNNDKHNIEVQYEDNVIKNEIIDNITHQYLYDDLNRLTQSITNQYTYKNKGKRTSLLIETITNTLGTFNYKYDELNNITHIYLNGNLINRYYYDTANQLIKDDNYLTSVTTIYTYDLSGNILSKKIYALNTENLISEKDYEYSNSNWEDQLTKYDNKTITYDSIGNPLSIGNDTLAWINGRQLYSYNGTYYKYNKDGVRIKKSTNNVDTDYYIEGNRIIFEKRDNNVIYYIYSDVENLIGFVYNNNTYYYIKNLQQDIIGIIDSNNSIIAKYTYDSLGNILSITDSNDNVITNQSHVGIINPFRYRSYYYDSESNLYYLNSRYYSPEFGRFINEDGLIGNSKDLNSYNLYAYSNNNFINSLDYEGKFSIGIVILGTIVLGGIAAKKIAKTLAKKKEPALPIASRLLQKSLDTKPTIEKTKLDTKTENLIIEATQKSATIQGIISEGIKSSTNGKFEIESSLAFEINESEDLFAAIHRASYKMYGTRIDAESNEWSIDITISDKYDFPLEKDYEKKYTFLNNGAYLFQELGLLTPYEWDVTYTYKYTDSED